MSSDELTLGLAFLDGKIMRYVEIAMGIILIIVGTMLFLGTFETISRYGLFVDFGL